MYNNRAVSWVGPEPAPVWLDLAREYTEWWHHQQHIRDAVGKPGLKQPNAPAEPTAEVILDPETAWRLLTRGISQNLAREQAIIKGNPTLGLQVFEMVSIIA